jgi:hypothetical protein
MTEVRTMGDASEVWTQLIREIFSSWFWIPLLVTGYFGVRISQRFVHKLQFRSVMAEVKQTQVKPPDADGNVDFQFDLGFEYNGQSFNTSVQGKFSNRVSDKRDITSYQWFAKHKDAKHVRLNVYRKDPRENFIAEISRDAMVSDLEAMILLSPFAITLWVVSIGSFLMLSLPNVFFGKRIEVEIQSKISQGGYRFEIARLDYSQNMHRFSTHVFFDRTQDRQPVNSTGTFYLERSLLRPQTHFRATIWPEFAGTLKVKILRDKKLICQKEISKSVEDRNSEVLECG